MVETVEIDYDEVLCSTKGALILRVDVESVVIPHQFVLEHDEEEKVVKIPAWLAVDRGLV